MELESTQLAEASRTSMRFATPATNGNLAAKLELEAKEKNEMLRTAAKTERMIRELQFQVTEGEKVRARYEAEIQRMEQRIARLQGQVQELVRICAFGCAVLR
jgi:hypothetical protein